MIAFDFGVDSAEQVLRLVRALGAHRYIAGRLHLVHALGIACIGDDANGTLAGARAWARSILDPTDSNTVNLDVASRDPLLWRACSDAELIAVFDAYWTPGERAAKTRDALRAWLDLHHFAIGSGTPFDESVEGEIHPLIIDAGWQLLDLGELDPERHKGAAAAFGDMLAFASALFEEETAIPRPAHLCELPAIGAAELLHGVDDAGALTQPFVVWIEGNETYVDYVLRGVRRAAKLDGAP
jgi:hypothetical protein